MVYGDVTMDIDVCCMILIRSIICCVLMKFDKYMAEAIIGFCF